MLSTELSPLTAEDCCVYNMLKLTRHVFAWSPQASTWTITNACCSTTAWERSIRRRARPSIICRTETDTPRSYAKPFDSFWCCSGTGAEEFAKLTDTIYFHDDNSIFVNLYIASDVNWPEKGIRITQQTSFPEEQGTTLTISAAKPVDVDLKLRVPYWAKNGSVKVNGRPLPAFADAEQLSRSAWTLEERGPHRTEPSHALARSPHARQGNSSGGDVRPAGIGRTLRRRTAGEVVPALYRGEGGKTFTHTAIQGQAQ